MSERHNASDMLRFMIQILHDEGNEMIQFEGGQPSKLKSKKSKKTEKSKSKENKSPKKKKDKKKSKIRTEQPGLKYVIPEN